LTYFDCLAFLARQAVSSHLLRAGLALSDTGVAIPPGSASA
jgi:hypothetical protein